MLKNWFLDENGNPRNPLDKEKTSGRKKFDGFLVIVVGLLLLIFSVANSKLSAEVILLSLFAIAIGVAEIWIVSRRETKTTEDVVEETKTEDDDDFWED